MQRGLQEVAFGSRLMLHTMLVISECQVSGVYCVVVTQIKPRQNPKLYSTNEKRSLWPLCSRICDSAERNLVSSNSMPSTVLVFSAKSLKVMSLGRASDASHAGSQA